ncbi:MAG TPA: histidine kinase [Streptosporangiaceae bacterium]
MALATTIVVLIGYEVVGVVNEAVLHVGAPRMLAYLASLVVVFALQVVHSSRAAQRWSWRVRALSLSAQAVATYLPFFWIGNVWGSQAFFLAGSMLLLVRGVSRWVLSSAVTLTVVLDAIAQQQSILDVIYAAVITMLTAVSVYGMSLLYRLVLEVHDARGELAQSAVTRERMRVARDLHDLLGYSLSAITLKSELAYRLLPTQPGRALEEMSAILGIARQALADVRLVAQGYRDMSLAAEAESARAVLSAADMEVSVEVPDDELAPALDTVLATVLREAVTNILRHSKAEHCEIHAFYDRGVAASTVRLEVVNDGVTRSETQALAYGGSGLRNLLARLQPVGGELTARVRDDGRFHLVAEIPTAAAVRLPDTSAPAREPDGVEDRDVYRLAPRVARATTLAVLVGYGIVGLINVAELHKGALGTAAYAVCFGAAFALQVAHSSQAAPRWSGRRQTLTLSAQAVASYLPLAWIGVPWGGLGGFFGGSVLLLVRGRVRWVIFSAITLFTLGAALATGQALQYVVYLPISTLLTGLIVHGLSLLSRLILEVHEARGELARIAVLQERLRVARDLHDLLGYSLTAIMSKSELACHLLPGRSCAAREPVSVLLGIARQALADVRMVASGYRDMSLVAEVESARAVLRAAEVEVRLAVADHGLPGNLDTVLAMALREAVTNVLRHSDVRGCEIQTRDEGSVVRLEVVNDGVAETPRNPIAGDDSGLGNLESRLQEVGGTLTAGIGDDGRFHLVAEVPYRVLPSRPPTPGNGAILH